MLYKLSSRWELLYRYLVFVTFVVSYFLLIFEKQNSKCFAFFIVKNVGRELVGWIVRTTVLLISTENHAQRNVAVKHVIESRDAQTQLVRFYTMHLQYADKI